MCLEICAQRRTWASCELDSKEICARLENVGELEDHARESKMVGECDGPVFTHQIQKQQYQ